METQSNKFKVAVLGGGVTGTSIFYTLCKYTNIDSIALFEKCGNLGQISSRENNNSQTLHFGDIEANYSLEKAMKTKEAAQMVAKYLQTLSSEESNIYSKGHKMLLAVGKEEIARFEKRFLEFGKLFPTFRKISREEIAQIEPEIVHGRNEKEEIVAGYDENGYVVDFGALAESFVKNGKRANSQAMTFLNTKILKISQTESGYELKTNKGIYFAETIVVAMCSHSLLFAKKLGYGQEYSLLPVGGNFYTCGRKVLNGKVYTMQSGKLPFAGVHGDPNIYNQNQTRFGPTANVMPFLERNNSSTFFGFIKSSAYNLRSVMSFLKVICEKTLFIYLLKSLIYEIPFFGPRAYAKLCQKIIPSLKYSDFKGGKSRAEIRPQLINVQTGKLQMGEIEIIGKNIIFNISPSPGATVCLKNAEKNVLAVMDFFKGKYVFNQESFNNDLRN